MDDEPYVRLPAPPPRWMLQVIAIQTAIELVMVAGMLLMLVAGAVLWAIRGVT